MNVILFTRQVAAGLQNSSPALKINECTTDYTSEEGNGLWISCLLRFLQDRIREITGDSFYWSGLNQLDEALFEEVPAPNLKLKTRVFTARVIDEYQKHCDWPDCDELVMLTEDVICDECNSRRSCEERCDHFYEQMDQVLADEFSGDHAWLQGIWKHMECRILNYKPLERRI